MGQHCHSPPFEQRFNLHYKLVLHLLKATTPIGHFTDAEIAIDKICENAFNLQHILFCLTRGATGSTSNFIARAAYEDCSYDKIEANSAHFLVALRPSATS